MIYRFCNIHELLKHVSQLHHEKVRVHSKSKEIAIKFLQSIMKSMESVAPRSVVNYEREWKCCEDHRCIDQEKSSEFRFVKPASYSSAYKLLIKANNTLGEIALQLQRIHS